MNKEIKRELFERQVDDDWDCSATKQMLNDEAVASAKLATRGPLVANGKSKVQSQQARPKGKSQEE